MSEIFLSLLKAAVEMGASDLHLTAPNPPVVRIDGCLFGLSGFPELTPDVMAEILAAVASESDRELFSQEKEMDIAYEMPELARFRVNASYHRKALSLSFRLIPASIPQLEQLGLPAICKSLATVSRGLVLLAGPTGCGKSTTIAAMIDYLNETTAKRIITIEDPIEFFHQNKKCMVMQRQVGDDTLSFATGLRQALRQDPDVIVIGEMRDWDTISVALTAAETGHLVLATVHTNNAVQAVERIIDVYPSDGQQQARYQLSMVLEGVIFQLLLPRVSQRGRALATEVLLGTPAMRNQIRMNELHQMKSYMQMGQEHGMHTIEQSLSQLVKQGKVSAEAAKDAAPDGRGA